MTDISFLDIREATPGDAGRIHDLMVTAQMAVPDKSIYVIHSEELVRNELSSSDRFGYVAEANGSLVSFALFSMDDESAPDSVTRFHQATSGRDPSARSLHCDLAATRPGFRMYGLASQLIHMGMERGVAEGCLTAWATADPRNEPAIRMLEGEGFVVYGTRGLFGNASWDYVMHGDGEDDAACERHAVVRHILCRRI